MTSHRPASLRDRGPVMPARSVYVHFPWCRHRCSYCDFATAVAHTIPRRPYLAAVLADLERRAELLGEVETIFFGGGTPSLWGPEPVATIIEAIANTAGLAADAEVTLEANPGASEPADLAGLVAAGINRLSLGVQSLDNARLRGLDRIHDADAARRALAEVSRLLVNGDLKSASADLLLGAHGQSMNHLSDELTELLDLGLPHLSTYTLTVESGTPLAKLVAKGRAAAPDDGLQVHMLEALPELVAPWRLARYEVSNLARTGHESRHNLACWRGEPYVGLGAAAHGFARLATGPEVGWRWGNLREAGPWQAAMANDAPAEAFVEVINAPMHLDERMLTGLRLSEGVDLGALRAELPTALCQGLEARARTLIAKGQPLELDDDHLRCTPEGLRHLDSLVVNLLA